MAEQVLYRDNISFGLSSTRKRSYSNDSLSYNTLIKPTICKSTSTPNISLSRWSEDSGYHELYASSYGTNSVHSDNSKTPAVSQTDRRGDFRKRLDFSIHKRFTSTPFYSPIKQSRCQCSSAFFESCKTSQSCLLNEGTFENSDIPRVDFEIDLVDDPYSSSNQTGDMGLMSGNAHSAECELYDIAELSPPPDSSIHLSHIDYEPVHPSSPISITHNQLCSSQNREQRLLKVNLSNIPHESETKPVIPNRFQRFLNSIVLDRLIGRHMALPYIDILSELDNRNLKHCTKLILSFLAITDICRLSQVSQRYLDICNKDRRTIMRMSDQKKKFRRELFNIGKENANLFKSRHLSSAKEEETKSSRALRDVNYQPISSTSSIAVATTPCKYSSRFDQFVEAASKLNSGESLLKCPRCDSPSRVLPIMEKGECFNRSCSFNFCIKCRRSFHGTAPCVMLTGSVSTGTVSSKISRKNLRRL